MNQARNAFYPGQAPIDAYGNGGFRFADMSHRGSLLCLPDGIRSWHVASAEDLRLEDLAFVLSTLSPPSFLLLGTGDRQMFPSADIRMAFSRAAMGLEPMSTGAACRTYNVLLAEGRPVAAALIATR